MDISAILFIFLISFFLVIAMLKFSDNKFFLKQRTDRLLAYWIIGLIVLGVLLICIASYFYRDLLPTALTVFFAVFGWLITNLFTAKNSIRQHTVAILTQTRLSTEYIKHAHNLLEFQDNHKVISKEMYLQLDYDKQKSITYFLNTLEFIAAGIRLGDFDEDLVKAAQQCTFQAAFKIFTPLIISRNNQQASTYEHLLQLKKHWQI